MYELVGKWALESGNSPDDLLGLAMLAIVCIGHVVLELLRVLIRVVIHKVLIPRKEAKHNSSGSEV